MRRETEKRNGVGDVYEGSYLLLEKVRYKFTAWQEMPPDGEDAQVSAQITGTGSLPDLDSSKIADLFQRSNLELHFEEGRRWALFMTDASGELVGRSAPR